MRKALVGTLDFETRNSSIEMSKNETSIWLGVLYFDDDNYQSFSSLAEMFDLMNSIVKENRKRKNYLLYIHNLSFETSFILDYLLRNGFTFDDKVRNAHTFNFLANSSLSVVYNLKIRIKASGGLIEMRDSARLFMCSLSKLAKEMHLPQKGKIDYEAVRDSDYKATEKEISYCVNDNRIVKLAVDKSLADPILGDYFKSSLTAGSFAAKVAIGRYGYPRSYKPMNVFRKETQYPILTGEEKEFARSALSGGLTWINPKFQFLHVKNYHHIDIHSAHPTQAYRYAFPFGFGEHGVGKPLFRGNRVTIAHVRYSYDDIIVPCFIATKDLRYVNGVEAWLYDFEIELAKRAYVNFRIDEYIDFYEYHKKYLPWRKFYLDTFEKKKNAKAIDDGYQTTINKIFLNAGGYGKFVERGHSESFIPFIDEEGVVRTNKVERVDNEEREGRYTYCPMGAMIPARTRYQLVSTALDIIEHGGEVIYTDTDSIFFIGAEDYASFIKIGEELGEWSLEGDCKDFEAYVPKRYIYRNEKGEMESKAGGFNQIVVDDTDDFFSMPGFKVLMSKRVKGGTILIKKQKDLNVPDKYREILKANRLEEYQKIVAREEQAKKRKPQK